MNTLIAITGLGILCLLFEILNLRKGIIPMTIVGLLAILVLTFGDLHTLKMHHNNMLVTSPFSTSFSALFIILTIFLVALSHEFYKNQSEKLSDFIAIKIFLLAGAVAMVSFGNLAMFFLGIEVLSISVYILAASKPKNVKSNEAGMKYFLMGSFASGIILFGICLIYGAMGTFDVLEISESSLSAELPIWFPIGMILITIGMLFKVAIVPFHFWAPDVYEGAPALTTATMSTLVKVVVVATLYKLILGLNLIPSLENQMLSENFILILVLLIIASMSVGNIMALKQENVKRMLAFSGISHAGFMLMPLLSNANSTANLFYYTSAYALAGLAAFSVILSVCNNKDNENIDNFNGLGKRNPIMAAVLTSALLSMAGIPIFAGFFAKLFLFQQTIEAGHILVVIAAIINSIISVGYYFKLILAMYTKESESESTTTSFVYQAVAIIAILLNIAIGLMPNLVLEILK